VVLVEARVLGGDDSVLEVGRDLAERNEFVAFLIGLVMNPGLQAALDMHRGCGWVDPSGGDKGERGERPEKDYGDDKPSNERPEKALAERGLVATGWPWCHRFRIIAWAGWRIRRSCAREAGVQFIRETLCDVLFL